MNFAKVSVHGGLEVLKNLGPSPQIISETLLQKWFHKYTYANCLSFDLFIGSVCSIVNLALTVEDNLK